MNNIPKATVTRTSDILNDRGLQPEILVQLNNAFFSNANSTYGVIF